MRSPRRTLQAVQFCLFLSLSTIIFVAPGVRAQTATSPSPSKINVVIGLGVGGAYDIHARVLSRHMGRYLPGNPVMVPQNMTGAGGLVMANWLYNIAPKDGTSIGTLANTMPALQAVGGKGVQFDAGKFYWLGAITPSVQTIGVWHTRGYKSIKDAQDHEILVAASSPGAIAYAFPRLLNEFIGTKFKIITGYQGVAQMSLAMERGEVDAHANTWSGWKTANREWVEQGKVLILAQINPKAHDLPNVPAVEDLVVDKDDREIVEFVVGGNRLGRPFAAPPNVPLATVLALRQAFAETMKDVDFISDAAKLNVDVEPVGGEEMQKLVEKTLSINARLAERAKPFLSD